jgi:hypothetical protein
MLHSAWVSIVSNLIMALITVVIISKLSPVLDMKLIVMIIAVSACYNSITALMRDVLGVFS